MSGKATCSSHQAFLLGFGELLQGCMVGQDADLAALSNLRPSLGSDPAAEYVKGSTGAME